MHRTALVLLALVAAACSTHATSRSPASPEQSGVTTLAVTGMK